VLKGDYVDVITSNAVLAEAVFKERESFYAMFKVSVTHHNNPDPLRPYYIDGLRSCYSSDIVYGTIGSYLHNNLEALGTKVVGYKNSIPIIREYMSVIIDECDNVILDNYALITNQAKPVAGVDHIKFVFLQIWIALTASAVEHGMEAPLTASDEDLLKKSIENKLSKLT
jgi:preprotein translocase subunit SecA